MTSEHEVHHPTPGQYWTIAGVLAVLTAVEVVVFYVNQSNDLGIFNGLILLTLAVLKFVIVVGWYMHLRFESPLLSRFFSGGFILAMGLYAIMLAALGVLAIQGA